VNWQCYLLEKKKEAQGPVDGDGVVVAMPF
jgi:hypothetical protein